jgi:hypothetical protein
VVVEVVEVVSGSVVGWIKLYPPNPNPLLPNTLLLLLSLYTYNLSLTITLSLYYTDTHRQKKTENNSARGISPQTYIVLGEESALSLQFAQRLSCVRSKLS